MQGWIMTQMQLYICLIPCRLGVKNEIKQRLRNNLYCYVLSVFIWYQDVCVRVKKNSVGKYTKEGNTEI